MTGTAPSLAELQARFQAALLDGSDDILAHIPPNTRTTSSVLFGVYRHAYVARLIEVLRLASPMLALHMGDEAFEEMALSYVRRSPSRHANARWYAQDLPEFLAGDDYTQRPELTEIASIERQLDTAFDASDAPVLDLNALAAYPPDAWGALRFVPHPSAHHLMLPTNAFDIWIALKNGEPPPAATLVQEAQALLVWRQGTMPMIRRLSNEESMFWRELARGSTFGGLAEMAAVYDGSSNAAVRVAQYLGGWLQAGAISEAMTMCADQVRLPAQSGVQP
jgi:hypothetical protein